MKKFAKIIVAMMIVAAIVIGCSPQNGIAPDGSSTQGGVPTPSTSPKAPENVSKVFSFAVSENMASLDPHNDSTLIGKVAHAMVYESLLYYNDETGEFLPYLCDSYQISDDGLTWTFKLREGITFSNGETFNADDCIATWRRMKEGYGSLVMATNFWENLVSYGKEDDYTFWFKTSVPEATMRVALFSTRIIPNEAYEELGEELFRDGVSYGTGPWVLDKWIDGQYIHFVKNPNYWHKDWYDPYYDEVYQNFMVEPSSAIASHLSGDISAYIVAGGLDNDMLGLYSGTEDRIEQIAFDSGNHLYLGLSFKENSPFLDHDVRRAMELSINRESIVNDIIGDGRVAKTIFTTNEFGYNDDIPQHIYDPEAARQVLADSTYDGRKIVLSSNTSTLKAEEILLTISENMNDVGFNTSVEIVEAATLISMRATGEYDAFMVANMNSCGEHGTDINNRIGNDAHHSFYPDNGGEPAAELIKLVKAQLSEMDLAKRRDILYKIQENMHEHLAPHLSLCQLVSKQAVDYGVVGIELMRDGTFRWSFVDFDPNSTHCSGPDFNGF